MHYLKRIAIGASDDDGNDSPGPDREKEVYLHSERQAIVRGMTNVANATERIGRQQSKNHDYIHERLTKMQISNVQATSHLTGIIRELSNLVQETKGTILRRLNSVNLRVARVENAFEQADLLIIPEDERMIDEEES